MTKKKTEKDAVEKIEDKIVETAEEIKDMVEETAGNANVDFSIDIFSDSHLKNEKKVSENAEEKKKAKKKTSEKKEEGEEKVKEKVAGKKPTKKELLARAKKLAEEIKEDKGSIKEKLVKIKEEEKEKKKKESQTLVEIEDYVKYGIHIGTKVITPHIRPYVYRRRADGIAIIDTNKTDKKLKEAIDFLVKYNPEDFIVVCKREAGWHAVEKFAELTGVRIFTKKYPAGIITNSALPNFFETDLIVACDPWLDKNAMRDAQKTKKKIMALCDTNNYAFNVDVVVPCNNKSNKSIGLVMYILAREYIKAKKIDKKLPEIDEFVGEKVE